MRRAHFTLRIITMFVLLAIVFSGTFVSFAASHFDKTVPKSAEYYLQNSGSNWSLSEHYDIGSSFPYDDVYATAYVGVATGMGAEEEYILTSGTHTTGLVQSGLHYSIYGGQFNEYSIAGGIGGIDFATGHIYSCAYQGYDSTKILYVASNLTIQ